LIHTKPKTGHATTSQTDQPAESPSDSAAQEPTLTEGSIAKLMHMLVYTRENEFSCEETFALLDEYVELVENNPEAAVLMPLVKQHLDSCSHCQEYYDALRRILQTES